MHPIQYESLLDKIIFKIYRLVKHTFVNWYRLGEAQQAWYLKKLFKLYKINLVIDAGGNLGQYATFLRKKVGYKGKIITIEPMQFAADELIKKFKHDKNWSLEQCAISDVDTFAEFNILNGHLMSSMLQPSSNASDVLVGLQKIVEKSIVKVKMLDTIFKEHSFCQEDVNIYLKLDIQGKELAALRGCKNKMVEKWYLKNAI